MRLRATIPCLLATLACAACDAAPAAARSANVAAPQIALRAAGAYSGPVDGIRGAGTAAAVRRVQQRAGLRDANVDPLSAL